MGKKDAKGAKKAASPAPAPAPVPTAPSSGSTAVTALMLLLPLLVTASAAGLLLLQTDVLEQALERHLPDGLPVDRQQVAELHRAARAAAGLEAAEVQPKEDPMVQRYPHLWALRRSDGDRAADLSAMGVQKQGTPQRAAMEAIQGDYARGEAGLVTFSRKRAAEAAGLLQKVYCGAQWDDALECDGVVDCCDGRDEVDCGHGTPPRRSAGPCADTVATKFARLEEGVKEYADSLLQKQAMLSGSQMTWQAFQHRLSLHKDDFAVRYERFRVAASDPDADKDLLMPAYQQLSMESEQLGNYAKLTKEDFAPDDVLLPLLGRCLSLADSEKYTKGGSAQPVAQNFNYTVCLFDKVVQQQLPQEAAVPDADADPEEPAAQDAPAPVLLGGFSGWARRRMPATDSVHPRTRRVQVYKGGAPCFEGPERECLVAVECGLRTRLKSVFENGKCAYEVVVSTPLACSFRELYARQEEAQAYLDNEALGALLAGGVPP